MISFSIKRTFFYTALLFPVLVSFTACNKHDDDITAEPWSKTFKFIQPTGSDIKLLATAGEMEAHLYRMAGMSETDFHNAYTLNATSGDGTIDLDGSLLRWTLDANTVWNDADGNLGVTVTYEPNNAGTHNPITVTFQTTVIKPSISYSNKYGVYWYDNESSIEVNSIVPETMTDDADFAVDIDNVFTGNAPSFAATYNPAYSPDTYENQSTAFDANEVQGYRYYFADTNKGSKVTGIDGKEYTLGVSNDINGVKNVFLTAILGGTTQIVAHINPANGVVTYNNRYVLGADYRTGYQLPERPWLTPANIVPAGVSIVDTYAKALLNKAKRNSGEEFWAWVGVDVQYAAGTVSGEEFKSRFLRPVNVAETTTNTFEDGVVGGSTLAMLELVVLSDWRSIAFTKANGYYNYYGIKSITIDAVNITTNLGGNDLESKLLSEVNPDITITPNYKYDSVTPDYGTVTYANTAAPVGDFKVRIPVNVEYLWGTVTTYVVVDVADKS